MSTQTFQEFVNALPTPVINVTVQAPETGTTIVDVLLYGLGVYAAGIVAIAMFDLVHYDWDVDKLVARWYHPVFWPVTLPAHWMIYSYLRSKFVSLATELPEQCSSVTRVLMNTMAPGIGRLYCDAIERLNDIKLRVGAAEATVAASGSALALLEARRASRCQQ